MERKDYNVLIKDVKNLYMLFWEKQLFYLLFISKSVWSFTCSKHLHLTVRAGHCCSSSKGQCGLLHVANTYTSLYVQDIAVLHLKVIVNYT